MNHSTRRAFLADAGRAAAAAAWLSLPWLSTLEGCTTHEVQKDSQYGGLSPVEVRALQAFAFRIIPAVDGSPGAAELGAVRFVDRALGESFFAPSVPVVRAGLADLDLRARALDGGREFASLKEVDQVEILRQVEAGDFFRITRTLVLIGAFSDPSYGGNRGGAGWTLVGIDHRPGYAAPFGYYDGPVAGAA